MPYEVSRTTPSRISLKLHVTLGSPMIHFEGGEMGHMDLHQRVKKKKGYSLMLKRRFSANGSCTWQR
jgi:hypothetical protein